MLKQLLLVSIVVAAFYTGDAFHKKKLSAFRRKLKPRHVEAEMAIVNLIRNKTINGNDLPFIGGLVRLAFHDCIGKGGCDGCIDHTNPSNGGLKKYTDELDYVFGSYNFRMSRADFYALSSIVALGMSTAATKVKFTGRYRFRFGRKSCKTSPNEDDKAEEFPTGHHGTVLTLKFFKKFFNFSPRETTALLGAHTLGRARIEDSGWEGRWVDDTTEEDIRYGLTPQSTCDNHYYHEILEPWRQLELKNKILCWFELDDDVNDGSRRNDPDQPNILLNSDFSLMFHFRNVSAVGAINCEASLSCQSGSKSGESSKWKSKASDELNAMGELASDATSCCPLSKTLRFVKFFDEHNAKWMTEFTNVFMKMIRVRHYRG